MLSVNTNVASLNAQRNLAIAGKSLSKSLERLSSGLRINRAADDAAGLAISEGLRSQVRGLNQAVRNANDGISMLSTAEGAAVEVTNMLQRVRELAVQSANDINSASNRASLQEEVDQLVAEITRVAETVEFNGLQLIDGSFTSKKLQVGAARGQTLDVSIGDMRAETLGSIALATSAGTTGVIAANTVEINGVDLGATVASNDTVSTFGNAYSAISYAKTVNEKSALSGVYANVLDTVKTGDVAVAGGTINAGDLQLNGVTFGEITVLAADGDGALRDAINAQSNVTGVMAELTAGNELVLTADDGRNISFDGSVNTGALWTTTVGFSTAADSTATFTGTYELYSDDAVTITGAAADLAAAGMTSITSIAVDANSAVSRVDVSTQQSAGDTIFMVDNALRQLSTERSKIGAYVNRLDSTVSNLRAISENLAASDSRIRDADFASETANLTKAQILQQAGTAILAQANVTPQAALSLLG